MSTQEGSKEETQKRQSKLTFKAFEQKLERLQHDRKVKVKQIKMTTREMTELMKNAVNTEKVRSCIENVSTLFNEASKLHDEVISMVPSDEQEQQNAWFVNVEEHKATCVEEANKWLLELPIVDDAQQIPAECAVEQECLPRKELLSNENTANILKTVMHLKSTAVEIEPNDSVSNASSGKSKRRSTVVSHKSAVSSTSSARLRAEAETAAIMARQKLLKEKHAMQEQQEQLRRQMEKQQEELKRKMESMDLDMELAASVAKMNVLKASEGSRVSAKSDGMNSYLQSRNTQLNVDASTFVPTFTTQKSQAEDTSIHKVNVAAKPKASFQTGLQSTATGPSHLVSIQAPLYQSVPLIQPDHNMHISQSIPDHRLFTVLEKQNEITSLLVEQQSLFLLPKRDLQAFDGDPLQYQTFMRGFEHNIEDRTPSHKDCLYYLEQYTRGQPRDIVRSCQHLPPAHGYMKAKALLQEHFGDPFKVASAYMDKVLSWPSVKGEDLKALQAYSLLLRECCNSMGESMGDLNVPSNMQTIVKKLPYKLRDRWRCVACDLQEKFNRRATFYDIVEFVRNKLRSQVILFLEIFKTHLEPEEKSLKLDLSGLE
ncbi:unnamed protein product [Knipowitschia caucasica]